MGKKDALLQQLDFGRLLELAKSVSESPINGSATRADLLKIVKESLSVEEIERKVKNIEPGRPSGELTIDELRAGGVGQLFLAIYAFFNPIGYFAGLPVYGGTANLRGLAPIGLISSIMLLIFASLFWISMTNITGKLGRNRIGTAASLIALITAADGVVFYMLTIFGLTIEEVFMGSSYLNIAGAFLAFSYFLLTGIMMTLLGVFFLLSREYSASSELWIAGGIIYIFAGTSYFAPSTVVYFYNMSIVAGIVGATCFFARGRSK